MKAIAILGAFAPRAVRALAERLERLLQGEPLRVIVYGAAITIWLVTRVALALGYEGINPPDLDTALASATAVAALLTEVCRQFVYSPASYDAKD